MKNKSTIFIFTIFNLTLFLTILITAFYIEFSIKNTVSDTVTTLVRNNFLSSDYKLVASDLEKSLNNNFEKIAILDNNKNEILSTGNKNKSFFSFINLKIEKPLTLSSNEQSLKGYLVFELNSIKLICISLVILIISLFFTFPMFVYLINFLKKQNDQLIEIEKMKTMSEVAEQVSHDIRSPLAALNMVIEELTDIPDNYRSITRSAVQRINDIANQLLNISKRKMNEISKDTNELMSSKKETLLSSLVDNIVSEKRIQYRNLKNVEIEFNSKNSFGIFLYIDSIEFQRVLSNLINNSIEAFKDRKGKVSIDISKLETEILIELKDNGKGIPSHILDKLGEKGVSHGKEDSSSGSGLGIFHAKKTIEHNSGRMEIISEINIGTTIRMYFNKINPPDWFLDKITIHPETKIITVDDDLSIHQIWNERFEEFKNERIKFTSTHEFINWIKNDLNSNISNLIFLIDFEFLNENKNGLEIIEQLNLEKNSFLVTSRYDNLEIIKKSKSLNLKIIPKMLVATIPIISNVAKIKYDLILVDNDILVQEIWKFKSKSKSKSFLGLKTQEEILNLLPQLDSDCTFFIDVELENGISGVELSKMIYDQGFTQIYLATGHPPENFTEVTWIKGVVGKNPKF